MLPKKNNSNANSQKGEKKSLEEKASKFIQENNGLSTSDLINKASQVRKPDHQKSLSQSKKSQISKPPIMQQKQQQKNEEKADNQVGGNEKQNLQNDVSGIVNNISQAESQKSSISMNERQQALKLKEKSREISLLNERIKTQEGELQNLKNQIEKYQGLMNEKLKQNSVNYNERRFLVMSQNIMSKQQQLFRMTQLVQLTRQIQYELENQVQQMLQKLLSLKEQMEMKQESFEGAFRIITFCEKQCERLRYIQSQQLHEQESIFEQKKNNQQQILEQLLKIDSCISSVINLFDTHRMQFVTKYHKQNFIDDLLVTQLDALSINLNRFIQVNQLPKMKLKPSLVLLQEGFQRVAGSFSKIFPHYNSVNELIKKQIQNDKIYAQIENITLESKQLTEYPLAIRSINILRSLLIHCLLSIHTFNFRPTFKPYFDVIQPFLKDSDLIFEQYCNNNQQIGQQVLWELFKSQKEQLETATELINKDMMQMKQEYQGYWNHKIFETQQQ